MQITIKPSDARAGDRICVWPTIPINPVVRAVSVWPKSVVITFVDRSRLNTDDDHPITVIRQDAAPEPSAA